MKKRVINGLIMFIVILSISTITAYATSTYLYNSEDVSYNHGTNSIESDNVQGAIDELYEHATDYTTLNAKVGTDALTTTSQNLSGAVNELNSSLNELSKITYIGRITNLNDVTRTENSITQGYYNQGATNSPSSTGGGFILTFINSGTTLYGRQIAISNEGIYTRRIQNGSWQSWKTIASG